MIELRLPTTTNPKQLMKCSKDAKRKFVATYRKRANSHPIRVRHPHQPLHSSPCSKSHFFTNQPANLSTCKPGNAVFKFRCVKSYRPSAVAISICNLIPRARSPCAAAAASSERRLLTLWTMKGWNRSPVERASLVSEG